ncbi:MAG TPA: AgmX/PglI C-terminal domain-containing protein [Polyangiaceae bacterium]|nr:AgmX/PglI C-terminal domain-containing protein [Polyangiaceae bacterium]
MPPTNSPPSSLPPPPPKHGGGQFIVAVIVMLLLMGGLVFWKLHGSDEKSGPAPSGLSTVAQEPTATVDQVVPPPPPPPSASAEDGGTPSTTKKPVASTNLGTNCGSCGHCTGEAAPGFSAVLRTRANQAQHCYEKALAQQESLQGRLTVNLCVGVGGAVCGASVSNDSLGSPMVAQCVTNIYRATTFPSPKNGCVDAQVPLNFLPEKK